MAYCILEGVRSVGWVVLLVLAFGCRSSGGSERAATAIERAKPIIEKKAKVAQFEGVPKRIYIRAFKAERTVEIWGAISSNEPMRLVATYPILAMSGGPGPKRKEGDRQVPEGLYEIDRFNPNSSYHLSLGLNYPNASDKVRSDLEKPGFDIFIHGSNVSIGCLAMGDPAIEEIWTFATSAREGGQGRISVHVFPCEMTERNLAELKSEHRDPEWHKLWDEIRVAYDKFEATRVVPSYRVAQDGAYVVD